MLVQQRKKPLCVRAPIVLGRDMKNRFDFEQRRGCFKCGEEGHMSRDSSHFRAACCGNLKDKTKTDSTLSKDQAANVGADQGW
ncbi:hypothetical protein MRX96_013781 [Rhipicephalus microplus]